MADDSTDESADQKRDEQPAEASTAVDEQATTDGPESADDQVTHPDVQAAEAVDGTVDPEPTAADPWEPPVSSLPASYYTEDGVPRFDSVAERIQAQLGAEELAEGSVERQSEKAEYEQLQEAGKDRLAEIRRQMGLDN